MFNKLREFSVNGAIGTGLVCWFLIITGSLVGLVGFEPLAEQMFALAGYGAKVFIPLLLSALLLTVAAPDR